MGQNKKIKYYKEIFGKFASGKVLKLELHYCETMTDMMKKIEDIEGIPCVLQKWIFFGRQLHNAHHKLIDYEIMDGCILQLSLGIIFVIDLNGPLSILQVENSDSLHNIKVKIDWELGFHKSYAAKAI